jgi:hypothetical protein
MLRKEARDDRFRATDVTCLTPRYTSGRSTRQSMTRNSTTQHRLTRAAAYLNADAHVSSGWSPHTLPLILDMEQEVVEAA